MASVFLLESRQFLPISLKEAWEYFSNPENLRDLTPPYLEMEIQTRPDATIIYPGQIIQYRIRPLWGIPMTWVTEITHVQEGAYFVDEQRFGPYAFWHHAHFFREVAGGVEMRDLVHYKIPLGFLGRWANRLFVRRQLEDIFEFRKNYLKNKYPSRS